MSGLTRPTLGGRGGFSEGAYGHEEEEAPLNS